MYRHAESESIKVEVKKMENEKQINLWLKKKSNGTWTVNGFVHDSGTQEVMPSATVVLDMIGKLTNARGFFSFEGIESGNHVILVQKEGYEATGDVNKPSEVEFVL